MPLYTYYCKRCDHEVSIHKPVARRKEWEYCPACGDVIRRDPVADARARTGGISKDWKLHSDAAAVHPSQIEEMRREHPDHHFDSDGRMVFRSLRHQRRCLKDIGMVNYDDNA